MTFHFRSSYYFNLQFFFIFVKFWSGVKPNIKRTFRWKVELSPSNQKWNENIFHSVLNKKINNLYLFIYFQIKISFFFYTQLLYTDSNKLVLNVHVLYALFYLYIYEYNVYRTICVIINWILITSSTFVRLLSSMPSFKGSIGEIPITCVTPGRRFPVDTLERADFYNTRLKRS